MEKLKRMYYYTIAIVVVAAVGSIGLKVYIVFAMDSRLMFNYVICAAELIELAYYCAIGSLIDICVRISIAWEVIEDSEWWI